ncbi:hypothetical protein SLS58_007672 [Diplodia intermedia]|uniref:Uncharacterized protein n=1 Tax=Diplodia intermedia TaxID=856260 RepID=A0ABR3TJZ0_9PEZI
MKTSIRAGTLASTILVLLAIFTILHHSRYLEGRWSYVDGLKDGIAEGFKGHLGTETVDDKYVGFALNTEATPALNTEETPEETSTLNTEDGQGETPVSQDNKGEENVETMYTVDDLNATLHTPMNKGKEAMVYLTYIIENYGNYPSTVAFIHSHKDRFWHAAGMPARSNMVALRALNTDYVQQTGFANLRCTLGPGCPAEVQPYRQDTPANRPYEKNMTTVWEHFFGTPCPEVIAAPCCAQFAVSRNQIMARPVSDYVLYRQWLMETELDDDNSGRVFEYLWHILFGQDPVHCPEYGVCWANVYGGLSMADLHQLVYAG